MQNILEPKVFFTMVVCAGMRARTWRDVIHYNGSLSSMMGHYSTALGKDRSVTFDILGAK